MEAVKDVSSLIYTKARGGRFRWLTISTLMLAIGMLLHLVSPSVAGFYSELDDCDLCSGDIADKAILSAMPGDLYGGSAYGSIYFEVRVSVW